VILRLLEARGGDSSSMLDVISVATKAGVVAAEIIQWAQYRNELGRLPTAIEYSTHWGISRRAGFRHQASIREAFPGDDFARVVEDVASALRAVKGRRRVAPRSLLLPV
jgi:hypothetical protein